MVILKGAKNKELALQFIIFVHEPQIYARIADYLELPTINKEARKYRKVKPTYEIEDLQNVEPKEGLGAGVDVYNRIWQEIRIGK